MKSPGWISTLAVVAVVGLGVLAHPAHAIVTFDWATVGNAGMGGVANAYRIAKHEVTNGQYAEFLNAVAASDPNGLYDPNMAINVGGITQSGSPGSFTYATLPNMDNKPVIATSFFDAMRFTNWLHNGQGAGGTETGVYSISDGSSEIRAADATFFIPSGAEWIKAAYHQPAAQGGDIDDFWLYPTASNSIPTIATANSVGDISNPGASVANYNRGADWNGADGFVTTVGSGGPDSASFYGTFDQGGNVREWSESLFGVSTHRRMHGGTWSGSEFLLRSSTVDHGGPTTVVNDLGFRVASPAPALISGDLNLDGFVGVDDLNIVLVNWNQNVTPGDLLSGDPTGEGFVGVDDLNIVLANWNNIAPAVKVPEPGMAGMLLVGLGPLARRRSPGGAWG